MAIPTPIFAADTCRSGSSAEEHLLQTVICCLLVFLPFLMPKSAVDRLFQMPAIGMAWLTFIYGFADGFCNDLVGFCSAARRLMAPTGKAKKHKASRKGKNATKNPPSATTSSQGRPTEIKAGSFTLISAVSGILRAPLAALYVFRLPFVGLYALVSRRAAKPATSPPESTASLASRPGDDNTTTRGGKGRARSSKKQASRVPKAASPPVSGGKDTKKDQGAKKVKAKTPEEKKELAPVGEDKGWQKVGGNHKVKNTRPELATRSKATTATATERPSNRSSESQTESSFGGLSPPEKHATPGKDTAAMSPPLPGPRTQGNEANGKEAKSGKAVAKQDGPIKEGMKAGSQPQPQPQQQQQQSGKPPVAAAVGSPGRVAYDLHKVCVGAGEYEFPRRGGGITAETIQNIRASIAMKADLKDLLIKAEAAEYEASLVREKLTYEGIVQGLVSEQKLKDLAIPLGPRKRILYFAGVIPGNTMFRR
ncbi:unnamed protein product [Vitrella brassicaformis CCMP3155]|uniref:SAM domain-containing protein n=2 Tax=Vitrella brassicaformis TaxID=1169539 RepID=A0A0G4EU99_VITBC|nr:unnamed protein product [Vitrella brassicaformis CCMP3155]|mmetsp:Transcript_4884/g.11353  ORF Transcript_4884/g.11353 Transcript_4884/m.11353 type:complete len:481 (+) Transcript_4884:259-1701(+)|eukprot:CEM02228.1 unnamed protein product [Vitrella brassicaformis CCMP3155]